MNKMNIQLSEDLKWIKTTIAEPLNEGRTAFLGGKTPNDNPYGQKRTMEASQHMAWFIGFMETLHIHQVTISHTKRPGEDDVQHNEDNINSGEVS